MYSTNPPFNLLQWNNRLEGAKYCAESQRLEVGVRMPMDDMKLKKLCTLFQWMPLKPKHFQFSSQLELSRHFCTEIGISIYQHPLWLDQNSHFCKQSNSPKQRVLLKNIGADLENIQANARHFQFYILLSLQLPKAMYNLALSYYYQSILYQGKCPSCLVLSCKAFYKYNWTPIN